MREESSSVVPSRPLSAMQGPPQFLRDGPLMPDGYSVNTQQPPYQPSKATPARAVTRASPTCRIRYRRRR